MELITSPIFIFLMIVGVLGIGAQLLLNSRHKQKNK
ncbi:hypothetical protein C8D98_2577 [Seleniivibrio woodruffii]|jgi:hypothetical protein|uniref:Uncharacterized protein n=1 Tax=Seleniivibrio woodruffii TaxID=1078050 RepID=A0A4R1K2U6_9BACT|nr:hypothetical protein C8D98_2577 [Seleniivibrio woodruffii]